jgi:hypothetical protein
MDALVRVGDSTIWTTAQSQSTKNEGSFVVVEHDGKIKWLKPEDLGF